MTKKAKLAFIAALALTRLAATPAFAEPFDEDDGTGNDVYLSIGCSGYCGSSRKRSCHSSEWARCPSDGAAPAVELRSTHLYAREFRRSGDHWRRQRRL